MPIIHKLLTKTGLEEKAITPLRAIRHKCLEYSNWSDHEVRKCHIEDCALFPYRFGRNPDRAGIGGPGNIESLRSATDSTPQPEDKTTQPIPY